MATHGQKRLPRYHRMEQTEGDTCRVFSVVDVYSAKSIDKQSLTQGNKNIALNHCRIDGSWAASLQLAASASLGSMIAFHCAFKSYCSEELTHYTSLFCPSLSVTTVSYSSQLKKNHTLLSSSPSRFFSLSAIFHLP